jgi:starch phosphorylase
MSHIDIHYGFSVNGVAAIHTDILKETELNAFYEIYPDKFNNKTNGITFRRWLLSCNRELTNFLTETIGDGYKKDATKLEKLLGFKDDQNVLNKIVEIKKQKKQDLAKFVLEKEGVTLNPDSIFDIQIKRLHEYKRQQMNALYIIHKYLEIKAGKKPATPVSFIFGAKAAPAYIIAQDIIHLLLVLQEIVNNDPDVSPYMTVLMVENYNVSYAEKLIPACDISEQISLASKEASGTGNMKFMLNGAVTLGTSDGANVEINDLVGDENIYIFGEKSDTVIEHYAKADYVSKKIYKSHPVIKEAVDFIVSKQALKVGQKVNLERLHKELINKDWFMTLLDLEDYIATKDKMMADYQDQEKWKKMMLVNIAKAGFFSSDRTIAEYNRDIWHLTSF